MFHLILKHRKKIFLILPCCLLVILISFLSGNAFWSSLHAESSDRQFRTFTRSLFQTEVSANTISLHYTLRSPSDYGIADIPATYGSLSSDPVAAKASVRNVLSSLQEFDPDTLSSENALTFKILDTLKMHLQGQIICFIRSLSAPYPVSIRSCLFCSRNTAFTTHRM